MFFRTDGESSDSEKANPTRVVRSEIIFCLRVNWLTLTETPERKQDNQNGHYVTILLGTELLVSESRAEEFLPHRDGDCRDNPVSPYPPDQRAAGIKGVGPSFTKERGVCLT